MRPYCLGALLAACLLGACGDDGDSASTASSPAATTASPATTSTASTTPATSTSASPPPAATTTTASDDAEAKIVEAVVKESLLTKDPSACTRLVTRKLLEQTTGERGAAAVKACRDDADNPGATEVSVDDVRVSGHNASADLRPSGGSLPFKRVQIGLRKSGGKWKVSRLKSGTLDRTAFFRVMRRELTTGADKVPVPIVDCAVKELDTTNDVALAKAYLKPDTTVLVIPVVICSTRRQLQDSGAPAALVECIGDGLRKELTSGALGRKLRASPSGLEDLQSEEIGRVSQRIAAACARSSGATVQ